MFFKNKSTYRQLAMMFGLLLLVNFVAILVTLRQLTIEPTATQMAMYLNMQLNSIEKIVEGKNFDQSKLIIEETFVSQQVVIQKEPKARAFPDLKFYNVLSRQLSKNQQLQVALEESENKSKIWIKPEWIDDYWLGIEFQPFVKKVSRLLVIVVFTLLLMSLIAAFFFSRYMLKPFKQLAQMAVDIVEQKPVNYEIITTGTKEVQEIAQLVKSSAQQIQKLNKEKEMLLAGVSHDLRTPLARMRLQAEFMNDDDTRDNLVQEIEEMDQIIGDFVTYVRSGTIEEFHKIDISEIINETLDQFLLMDQVVEFEMPHKPIVINVKPLSFKRMLTNIIENAFKYGLAPVQISIEKTKKIIKIAVVDHGKGIDQENLLTVFEPFVMANNTDNQYGSGLGLSIVKKLAQQNKAEVYAENHKDGGLCVCIVFQKT